MKHFAIIFCVVNCLTSMAQTHSIFLAYHRNDQGVTNLQQSSGYVSIGMLKTTEPNKALAEWDEWFMVADTNHVLSLKMLMDVGSKENFAAAMCGSFAEVLFVDTNGIPQTYVAISSANCNISISDCRQDSSGRTLIDFDTTRRQVNAAFVGLVYGIIVRRDYGIIHRNRLLFGSENQGFDYFLFSPLASPDFWEAAKHQTNEIFGLRLGPASQ